MAVNINGIIQALPDAPNSFSEDGRAHFVVMKFDLSEESAADRVSVYLNPLSTQEPLLPSGVFPGIDFTLGAFGAPSWFGGTGRGPEFDEIPIGTEFVDVVPPSPELGSCAELDEAC